MTYLKRVLSRTSEPIQHGLSWTLYLECGHSTTRQGGQRGGTVKRCICYKCQLGFKSSEYEAPF